MRDPHDSTSLYPMLLGKLQQSWITHTDKPDETPDATLRALYLTAAGAPASARTAATADLPVLDDGGVQHLLDLVEQRCSGIPLAHLTGRQNFMGIELLAGSDALIPRMETEILGYEALWIASALAQERGSVTVLDVCTGCGSIALALAAHEPRCRVFGSDLSAEATTLAQRNARHLNLEDRVEFMQSDLFERFETEGYLGNADLITCNPPYISSKSVDVMHPEISRHEPRMAFDGGALGVSVMRRLIREAPRFLKPESFLCFEVGLGQGNTMLRALKSIPEFKEIRQVHDSAGNIRALIASTGARSDA